MSSQELETPRFARTYGSSRQPKLLSAIATRAISQTTAAFDHHRGPMQPFSATREADTAEFVSGRSGPARYHLQEIALVLEPIGSMRCLFGCVTEPPARYTGD